MEAGNKDDGICFETKEITVENSKINSEKILTQYRNSCMGIGLINYLAKTLTNLCISKSFMMSRVLVKQPQDFKDAHLSLSQLKAKLMK